MIFTGILSFLISVLNMIFNQFHLGTVSTIPFVDAYLVTGRGYLEWWITYFPPLQTLLTGFMWVLGIKVVFLGLKFFKIFRA